MNEVFIITPIISRDIEVFLCNFTMCETIFLDLRGRANYYIACQNFTEVEKEYFSARCFDISANVHLIYLEINNVSVARNVLLNRISCKDDDVILFMDSSIKFSHEFLTHVLEMESHVLMASNNIAPLKASNQKKVIKFYDFVGHPYIWSFAFKWKTIAKSRFNEKLGPGDGTKYKSGEDVLFLHNVLKKINYYVDYSAACVYHPPRTNDYRKYLIYASGQANVIKALILHGDVFYTKAWASFRLILFVFGSFRFIFHGREGVKIFHRRLASVICQNEVVI
ncbi:hypothetical protein [Aeromonas caviae]|uniref:hypothetical protein n=1 Tax=Aeromonas caviae TaxID=648 RepID=UPI002258A076|nr:hypothetical protein [Aeromonas caviae]MCX4073035.1 hypothetical protein [Aeromonas caviae]